MSLMMEGQGMIETEFSRKDRLFLWGEVDDLLLELRF